MRSIPQLLLLLSTALVLLTVTVRSEEQPNPVTEADVTTTSTNGQTDEAEEEVQDAPSTVNGSSEGGIVAIHVDAVGGKEQLRPTLRGLTYLATTFLPRDYKFVEILLATREVVAGVRYELTASAEDETTGEKHICQLVILEKPWITTEYGEKYRTLEYTNCSSSTSSAQPSTDETATRLNPVFDANLRQNEELTPQRIEELEQQIIVDKVEMLEITSTPSTPLTEDGQESSVTDGSITSSTTTEAEGLSDAAKSAIDELFSIASAPLQNANRNPPPQREGFGAREEVVEETIVPVRIVKDRAEVLDTMATPTTTTAPIAPLDQQVQSTFDEVFKTHQQIQKALDEVIANGGGRDVQLKYRPVFDSLLQKVKASIDSYYRSTNGGDANVDTAAFVVRDNTNVGPSGVRGMIPTSSATSTPNDEQSSQESDEGQQRQMLPTVNLKPFRVSVAKVFGTVSDEDMDDQQVLTREQLAKELNDEERLQRVKKHSVWKRNVRRSKRETVGGQVKAEQEEEAVESTTAKEVENETVTTAGDTEADVPTTIVPVESLKSDVTTTTPVPSAISTAAKGIVAAGTTSSGSKESDEINPVKTVTETKASSESSEDDDKDEKLSKEELARQLNADEGLRRGKRDFSGGFSGGSFGGYSGGSFGGGSYSGGGYYGGGYYGGGYYGGGYYGGGYYNPYRRRHYRPSPYYYGHYRSKRSAAAEDMPVNVDEQEDVKMPQSSTKSDLQAPKIERVMMAFGDSNEEDQVLTKEQLVEQLNADDGHRRDKRGYSSSFYSSSESHGYDHRVRQYVKYNVRPSYANFRYNTPYRGKRAADTPESNLIDLDDPAQEASMKVIATQAIQRLDEMDTDPYQRMLLEVLDARKVSQRSDNSRATYVLSVLTANSRCAEEESKVPESCRERLISDTTKQCTLEVHVLKAKEDDTPQVQLTKSKCQKQSNNLGDRLVGGATPVDLSKPEHQERVRLGLVGYESGKHSNFEILFGTVQVVAGTIHRYKIALKDGDQQVYSTCDVKVFTPLPSATNGSKPDYDFDCAESKDEESSRRRRRDVEAAPKKLNKVRKAGGAQELTPEEYAKEEHQARVRTGLQQQSALVDGSGNERKVKIVGATMQLVAGKSYTYRLTFPDDEMKRVCKLTVWEKPWLKEKAPQEAFKASFECPDSVKRAKRDSYCQGCASPLPAEEYGNAEHQQRIDKILSSHGLTRGNQLKVINATSQVAAGMVYVYYVQHNSAVCKLTSWERVWLEKSHPKDAYKYTYECEKEAKAATKPAARTRRSIVGGSRTLSQDELAAAEHIERVDKILVSNGGTKESSNARIVSGTVQIVAGKLYKYAVEFSVDGGRKLCKLSSWERPWLEEKDPAEAYKYTVTCPDTEHGRQRRHAKKTGSSNELTADELKDKSHIERIRAGMVTYNSERSKAYNEFEILAGSTQQVAGSLYKYTFRVTTEPDTVCKISIWERVWLESQDQRKYNVKCTGDDDTEQQPDVKSSSQQEITPVAASTVSTPAKKRRRSVRSLKIDDDEHVRKQFEKFVHHHRRRYGSSMEHEMRFNIFRNNLFRIDQLNKFERGTAKYGVTKFADMTLAEYRAHTGLVVPNRANSNHIGNRVATQEDVADVGDVPRSFDWRDLGAVTGVKNQGSCGSCWAFSAIGNIEGLHQIKTKKLESYSEQELIDCDKVDNGCGGGYMDDAFKAIEQLGGLELETDYPYEAKAQKTCHFNKTLSHVQVKGAVDMPKNETFIAQYLVKNGPIAIGLNANAMQFYRGGISHPWHPLCSHKSIDHGVLIVGYGVKEYPMFNKTLPYWIIKNSWGPSWGEQGYYRIYRGDNSCGVSEMASSAILA